MAIVEAKQAEHDIDSLAKMYIGQDVYPYRQEGERRTISLIEPTHVCRCDSRRRPASAVVGE